MISLTRKLIVLALSIVTSVALAYSLFGLGFMVCTTPQATSLIGGTFSGWEHATYPEEDMAQIAEAVRSFSIEGTSSEELYNTIFTALQENQPQIAALFEAGSTQDNTIDTSLLESTISVGVVGAFGVAGLIALGILAGRKRLGATLIAASSLVIAVLIALGIWAAIDFNGIFTWMHTLLFAQGNWIFDADSLLITLFPEAFWAAMAGLWILSSIVLALLIGIVGKILAR